MTAHPFLARLAETDFTRRWGRVRKVAAGVIEADGPADPPGSLCSISVSDGAPDNGHILAEIVAVAESGIKLMPLQPVDNISLGSIVTAWSRSDRVAVGDAFAGRAIDALGRPIDGAGSISAAEFASLAGAVPRPLDRVESANILATGIRAIDGLLTLARGQRIGIFAASGVGKTSLIEQLAGQIDCDHCIVCLIGERGREVEALWRTLPAKGQPERFTLIAATSDESAALRARAASYALSLADHWRSAGKHVLLIVDSVTRLAMALRELGLAAGAPPTVRAYTPNIFTALPRLVEQCGATRNGGAITAIMTILSETDDVDDPIAELMKSLLDGHILLSRSLAEQGHFPAIDIPRSVSRGADRLVQKSHLHAARQAVGMLGAYEEARIMIESGVYKSGTNPVVDKAIGRRDALNSFLRQSRDEAVPIESSVSRLSALVTGGAARA